MHSSALIRSASASDIPQMREIYAPYVLHTVVSFETEIPSEEEMLRRLEKNTVQCPWLVCITEGKLAGYAYGSLHRDRAAYQWTREVSVYTSPDFRRRSIGTALYTALFSLMRMQGYTTLLAGISLPNPESTGFHESMGFRKIAHYPNIGYKFEQWHDTGWWALPLSDFSAPPADILSPQSVLQSPGGMVAMEQAAQLVKPANL